MSIKEDFRDLLVSSLTAKKRANRVAELTEKSRRRQEAESAQEAVRQRAETEARRIGEINQQAATIDASLPIGEYLEGLRDLIAPNQRVQKFGPEDGLIAYSIVYNTKITLITVGLRWTGEYIGGSSGLGGTYPGYKAMVDEKGFRRVSNVLGVVLMPLSGTAVIQNEVCANGLYCQKSINPLEWGLMSNNPLSHKPDGFMVNSSEGLQQFAQALTDFYVEQKAGQGK